MKKIFKIFAVTICMFNTSTYAADFPKFGYVKETDGDPIELATIGIPGASNGERDCSTLSDENGYWRIDDCANLPSNPQLQMSIMGYATETIPLSEYTNSTTTVLSEGQVLEGVTIEGCPTTSEEHPGATDLGRADDGECYPTECDTSRYELKGQPGTNTARCEEKECDVKNGTGEWTGSKNAYKCTPKSCNEGYKKNDDGSACIKLLRECTDAQKKDHPNAAETGVKKGTNPEVCIALECKCGYDLVNEKCVKWPEKKECSASTKPELPKHATGGLMKCNAKGKAFCEVSEGPCNADQLANIEHASAGELKKGECIPTECEAGFKIEKNKCVAEDPKLSEEDSKKKIEELKANAKAMKDKEQSTENKMLGAASMAATGLGAMQAMSAYSEKQADEEAEQAMKAYLATFHCNYGDGKNVQGGEKDVQLPGGNELVDLYAEYVNLANNLKVRKAALDMRPGIESESILDSATSGLYDDVAIGKTSGAFTSLARALMDPNGPDAIAWAKQKADTESKLKTGLVTAGLGAIGGALGNMLINKNAPKENSEAIIEKYEKLKKKTAEVQQVIDNLPKPTCDNFKSQGASGGTYPDCTCSNSDARFFVEQGCVTCNAEFEYNDENECVVVPPANCNLKNHLKTSVCECAENATNTENVCNCNNGYTYSSGKCEKVAQPAAPAPTPSTPASEPQVQTQNQTTTTEVQLEPISFAADATFDSGKSTIKQDAKDSIVKKLEELFKSQKDAATSTDFKINIVGHTDRTKFKNDPDDKKNQQLSENRANAIKALFTQADVKDANITTSGKGSTECTTEKYTKPNDPKCRRVDVTITAKITATQEPEKTNNKQEDKKESGGGLNLNSLKDKLKDVDISKIKNMI